MLNKNNCPICGSSNIEVFYKNLYDDRYGYSGYFDLLICLDCEHKFIEHQFTEKDLINLYTTYYPRSSFNINNYSPLKLEKNFRSWLEGKYASVHSYVPPGINILDIGCGFCESLGYHKNRKCKVYGVETDENVKKIADKYGFNLKIGYFDPKDYQSNFFDYVTLDQVLEHSIDPLNMLKGINIVLKDGGVCILSTPNSNSLNAKIFGKKWINWHVPYHLNFFSKKSINIAAEKTGFKIKMFKTITSSEWLKYQLIHVLTYPKPGNKSIFWSYEKSMKKGELIAIKLCALFHKTKIFHTITRLFDFLWVGDNFIIKLEKEK